MTFTTQSESVPLVDATRFAIGSPAILTGAVRTSDAYTRTSVRVATSRWSLVSHSRHVLLFSHVETGYGRPRNGTGFAGSETYSSYEPSPAFGGANPAFPPAER